MNGPAKRRLWRLISESGGKKHYKGLSFCLETDNISIAEAPYSN